MPGSERNIDHVSLITRYLSGEANQQERNLLEVWKEEKEENRKIFESFQRTWNSVDVVQDLTPDLVQEEWERLEKEIDRIDQTVSVPHSKRISHGFVRIAATIVFFVTAMAIVYNFLPQFNRQKIVAESVSQSVDLIDGSVVTLNAFSTLKYSKKFGKEERRVALSGEAFFDIERNEEKPFIIEVFDAEVKVLGTSFNILADEKSGTVQVVVQSGKVSFSILDTAVVLLAGDKGVYSIEGNTIFKFPNDDVNYLSWKTRKLIFDNMELQEIIGVINRVYRSNIEIGDDTIGQCTLSTTFEDQSLEAILEVIMSTLDIKSEKTNGRIILKGGGC